MPWVDGRRTADCQEVIPSDMRNHGGRKRDIFSTGIVMSQREDTREDVHSSHVTDGCHHLKHVVLQCTALWMDPSSVLFSSRLKRQERAAGK